MKRLINLTSGLTNINLDKVVNNSDRWRISQFEWTGASTNQTIHIKIDYDTDNYDESNDLYYNLFFMSYANGSITYTPANDKDGWFDSGPLSSHRIQIFVNGLLSSDISARNCYLELEYG